MTPDQERQWSMIRAAHGEDAAEGYRRLVERPGYWKPPRQRDSPKAWILPPPPPPKPKKDKGYPPCPYCGSEPIRMGQSQGRYKFRCKKCKRNYLEGNGPRSPNPPCPFCGARSYKDGHGGYQCTGKNCRKFFRNIQESNGRNQN